MTKHYNITDNVPPLPFGASENWADDPVTRHWLHRFGDPTALASVPGSKNGDLTTYTTPYGTDVILRQIDGKLYFVSETAHGNIIK